MAREFTTKGVVQDGNTKVSTLEGSDFHVGDCTMDRAAKIVLRPDGTGTFTAKVRGTDDDDEWHQHFQFKNAAGADILRVPASGRFDKKMPQPRTDYHYNENFSFAQGEFRNLARVDWHAEA